MKLKTNGDLEINRNPFSMELELQRAIEKDQFVLHYQPKVNLKTGKITGMEALIRWVHPQFGMLSPGTFIPIAEETGLIIPIGEWALRAACKQNKQWHQQGLLTVMSVNLSPVQFTQRDLVDMIEKILLETELKPKYLEVEITENMAADLHATIATLQKLKKLGVRISIDNFGTGFNSLNYLKQFPINTIKIDQSFVRNLPFNMSDETIVKTIISMAHHLDLTVVAEGVETKEQLVFLQQYLCDEGEGFFFTKPLSAEELEKILDDIQAVVNDFGLPLEKNKQMWLKELLRKAREELAETVRLQQGMIFKYKLINGRFIHTLCDGDLMYRLGLIPAEVVGKNLRDFLPQEIADDKALYYERAWNGEENVTYESRVNGISYLVALSPVKRGDDVVEVIGSAVDITERKRVEKELHESQKKYQLIAENMTDIVLILDMNGRITYASPSHELVLGNPPEYYEGKFASDHVHREDFSVILSLFKQVLESKELVKGEIRCLHNNGEIKLIECVCSPVFEKNGEVEYLVVAGRDITEKRKAEEQLRRAEKLQLVGELAAGVAHEIRNPITAIKGFIQLFQQGMIKDEYFEVILSEFNRVEDIIKEFLSLAKTQEMRPSFVSMPILIKEVETLLESEANLLNIQLTKEIEPEIPFIMCDANQIKQVLINLIKNSIEAIESEGKINIAVTVEEEYLVIKITDNGIGISEERLQRLGEPFYSNKEKGTGLGLMISFRIIKQHNGTMIFKSKENTGTTVEIKLPRSLKG